MLLVGNDIVDLNLPGTLAKSQDARFLDRVFSVEEQQVIRSSPAPDRTLWALWSAKETAYKIISKIDSPPVFSHRKFACRPGEVGVGGKACDITVTYQSREIHTAVTLDKHYVYAQGQLAHSGTGGKRLEHRIRKLSGRENEQCRNKSWVNNNFTQEELQNIRHPESLMVRYYCKLQLSQLSGAPSNCWQIIRRTSGGKTQPPFLLLNGQRVDADVSLTHHGVWLAWVLSL